jgi:hypothetical protein
MLKTMDITETSVKNSTNEMPVAVSGNTYTIGRCDYSYHVMIKTLGYSMFKMRIEESSNRINVSEVVMASRFTVAEHYTYFQVPESDMKKLTSFLLEIKPKATKNLDIN